jgi:hypothetical protein
MDAPDAFGDGGRIRVKAVQTWIRQSLENRCETVEFIRLDGRPRSVGRCAGLAAATIQVGCRHEHIQSAQVCDGHEKAAHARGIAMCYKCLHLEEQEHECPIMLIESTPLDSAEAAG